MNWILFVQIIGTIFGAFYLIGGLAEHDGWRLALGVVLLALVVSLIV